MDRVFQHGISVQTGQHVNEKTMIPLTSATHMAGYLHRFQKRICWLFHLSFSKFIVMLRSGKIYKIFFSNPVGIIQS